MTVLAIDPGTAYSAYALMTFPDFSLLAHGKEENGALLDMLSDLSARADEVAVEMVACYGMPVGREVFETCVYIGRLCERFAREVSMVYRLDEKRAICHDLRANDATIRRALIDRYAKHDLRTGKGTKKAPDVFYGISADEWQAIAVGVTHYEKRKED